VTNCHAREVVFLFPVPYGAKNVKDLLVHDKPVQIEQVLRHELVFILPPLKVSAPPACLLYHSRARFGNILS
jgi:hypothetical protein